MAPRAFLDMYNAIWEAENFIYITGWSVNVNIRLVRTDEKSDDERDYSLTVGQLLKNKAKRSARQQRSDVVIVFLVQCSQGSKEQTDHPKKRATVLSC